MKSKPLTKEIIEDTRELILAKLRLGMSRQHATQISGVDESTLYVWMKADPDFAVRVERAELDLQDRMLAIVQQAATRSWQAASWLLERKWSNEYALRTKQEISGFIQKAETESDRDARINRLKTFLTEVEAMKATIKQNEAKPEQKAA